METSIRLGKTSFAALLDSIASSALVVETDLAPVVQLANNDVQALAKLLLEKNLLTRFQIVSLSQGQAASLRIGNYDILDRIGAGGMGTVFKARHRRMKRLVALKVLAAKHCENALFVKRFQREVETIACLGHPNIVMAYDADEAEVGHFLVMEFVNGRDFADCVDTYGTFPLSLAVNCILQTARGLAYAHGQGIIHRDIKPHNLLLDNSGMVKVTDLGLARLNYGSEGPATGADVTMAGGVIGTVDYMPPEQALDSTSIDHRADIYSLGCTLYYLLAGKPPYKANTIMETLLKHRDAAIPSLFELIQDVPSSLENLFQRMLAKKPEQRIQTMNEVVAELEHIHATLSVDEAPSAGQTIELTARSELTADSSSATSELIAEQVATETRLSLTDILLVEPSRFQASFITGCLHEHSFRVAATVGNGTDALEAVRKLRPRILISAMHLPDMSGIQLAEKIQLEFQSDAPGFVLVTSENIDIDSFASGASKLTLLPKPFTPAQLIQALHQAAEIADSQDSAQKARVATRSQLRVMIVDDSSTARINMRTVLQSLGFSQFVEVPDGAHAIAVAAREICHLIVTDYNMPLMNGRALVSYLKQNPATSTIPIIMVTTETDPQVLDSVRQLGVVAIIEKAFPADIVAPLLDSLF